MASDTPAYMIAEVEILDEEYYRREYIEAVGPLLEAHGAEIIARGAPVILEGTADYPQTVILKFKNRQAAVTFYTSAPYKDIARHRSRSARVRLQLLDGNDELKPSRA